MANELNIQLNPFTETGLTLLGKVYNKSGTQQGTNVSMTDSNGVALYTGDFSLGSISDGEYLVRFETNSPNKLYGLGPLFVRNNAEVSQQNFFNSALDTVARVTLVDTTTANTDMRGTDGANTVAPDNAGIAAIPTNPLLSNDARVDNLDAAISSRSSHTPSNVYTEFTTGSNEDVFKADVSALATQASVDTVDANVDAVLVDTSTTIPDQIEALNDISAAEVNAEVDTALADYDAPTKSEIDSAFTEIKGAAFSSTTDTLEGIRDAVDTKASQSSVDDLNDFDPASDQVIVGTNNDKAGYGLTPSERTSISTAVESALINEGDGQQLIDAILQVFNANLDLPALELTAIADAVRAELTTELGRIDATISSRSTITTTEVKAEADQALTDANVDTKTNIKPSIGI